MAIFNEAFKEVYVGTQVTGSGAGQNSNVNLSNGFLVTPNLPTVTLTNYSATANSNYGTGSFGFFNKSWQSVTTGTISGCCPLTLAAASLYQNDFISPYLGGYQQTKKSQWIKPSNIRKFYRVDPQVPKQDVVHVGNTPYTDGGLIMSGIAATGAAGFTPVELTTAGSGYTNGTYTNVPLIHVAGTGTDTGAMATVVVAGGVVTSVLITAPGIGFVVGDTVRPAGTGDTVLTGQTIIPYTAGAHAIFTVSTGAVAGGSNAFCNFTFNCGQDYNLRIDIKGSPALRFVNHNLYHIFEYNTGCCTDPSSPGPVDSTLVMIAWANLIILQPLFNGFVLPVVVDQLGNVYYAPGTPGATLTWDNYVSPGYITGTCGGLILYGAFVATNFLDCTFQVLDYFEREPVKIYATMAELEGEICCYTGICVVEECPPVQGSGFGETIVRDLILSESYSQNFFRTDLRIREITQGNQILNAISRSSQYTTYFILFNIDRHSNPTQVYGNDQYLLEIVTTGTNTAFETFMAAWLDGCADCTSLETGTLVACTPVVPILGVAHPTTNPGY